MSDSTENPKQIITVGDQPAIKDELGFAPYVIAMAEFLTHPDTKPPLTISIEGEWGSGKSSFMKQLEAEVKKKSKELNKQELETIRQKHKFFRWKLKFWQLNFKQDTQTVWFNAWRHEKSDSVWATFALSFLEQLSKNRSFNDFIHNSWSSLLLLYYRLNWKEKRVKIFQALAIMWLMGTVFLSVPILIFFPDKVKGVLPWYEKLADIVKTDSKEEEKDQNKSGEKPETKAGEKGRQKNPSEEDKNNQQKNPSEEDKNNQLLAIWLKLGYSSAAFAGIGKLLAILKDLIGDPKMDLTQDIESPDYEKQVAFVEKFHEDFSKIVNAYVGKNEKIYVFIDDLDRCELGKSADLLQALNMMISNDPNIVFILGMDREKVAAAISFKQKDVIPFLASAIAENQVEENENQKLSKKVDYGFSFLEKFVQLSFLVPAPSQKTLDDFVGKISEMEVVIKASPEKQEKYLFGIPYDLIKILFSPQQIQLIVYFLISSSLVNFNLRYWRDPKYWIYLIQEILNYPKISVIAYSLLISYNEKKEVLHQVLKAILIKRTPEKTLPSPDLPIFPIIEKDLNPESLKLAVKIAADFFDYNPRRLKQYINALRLRIYITYYSIGVTAAETNKLTIEQISKFTALTLQYPRLLLALKRNPDLLADLEKYAVGKFIQSNYQFFQSNDNTVNSESRFNLQAEGNASYWINNYPKIEKLLCPEIESNNNQKTDKMIVDKIFGKDRSIKKLLEVSPQQSLPPKYFKLREYLAAEKWKEADEETYQVMLQVAGRERQRYLDVKDIQKFPCKDFRIIDQLWVEYSGGQFGFSVQKKIYQLEGGTAEYDRDVWEAFGKKVGWLQGSGKEVRWVSYDDLIFTRNAKHGHLPTGLLMGGRGARRSFFQRAETCRL